MLRDADCAVDVVRLDFDGELRKPSGSGLGRRAKRARKGLRTIAHTQASSVCGTVIREDGNVLIVTRVVMSWLRTWEELIVSAFHTKRGSRQTRRRLDRKTDCTASERCPNVGSHEKRFVDLAGGASKVADGEGEGDALRDGTKRGQLDVIAASKASVLT